MKPITVTLSALAFVGFAAAHKGPYPFNDASVSDTDTSTDTVEVFTTSFTESGAVSVCTKAKPPSPSSSDGRYPYNSFLTSTTTLQHWCNGYPYGENGELRTTAAAERRGEAIAPDTSYSPIHEPEDPCTTEEATASALPASSTLPADNEDPRATTAVYTIDCIHHVCPHFCLSGQSTVITVTAKPSDRNLTYEISGNPQTYHLTYTQKDGEKREAGVLTERRGLDHLPVTMETILQPTVTKNSAEMSFPDVPPTPTQPLPYIPSDFLSSSLSPLPQTVATTNPCWRHYCPPGQSAPGQLYSAK